MLNSSRSFHLQAGLRITFSCSDMFIISNPTCRLESSYDAGQKSDMFRADYETSSKICYQIIDKLDALGIKCIPANPPYLETANGVSVVVFPATNQFIEDPKVALNIGSRPDLIEVQYHILSGMLILAVNVPISNGITTSVYVVPFLEAGSELYLDGQLKVKKVYTMKERVKKIELGLTFIKDITNNNTETLSLNLNCCNYWDVYMPVIEPISDWPMPNQIDYLFRITQVLYTSEYMAYTIKRYFNLRAEFYTINTKEIYWGEPQSIPHTWFEPEALLDQIYCFLAHWLTDNRTEERLAILKGKKTLIQNKLIWLCEFLLVPICYGVCWSGRFDRMGWHPIFDDVSNLKKLVREICINARRTIAATQILGTNTKVYVCTSEAIPTVILMEDPDTVVLYQKGKVKGSLRPVSTMKDFKVWLADNINALAVPPYPTSSVWNNKAYFDHLVAYNSGNCNFEAFRSTAINAELSAILRAGGERSQRFLESL